MCSASNQILQGVLPVLQTPFTEEGEIDFPVLSAEIDWAFQTGADGVVVAMVSEILRIGYRGRRELAEQVCQMVGDRGTVVISVGAESTAEAVGFAKHAESIGATALMAIPPVATSLGAEASRAYFAAIANSVSIPLVVQDASGYVGASIDLSVYLDLLKEFGAERILFKPEASPLGPNLSKLRDATSGSARIFEGSGGIHLVDCYRRGIVGTMPGTDLLDGIVALWKALQEGDEDRIYSLSLPISGLVALQLQAGLDGFLAIEKYLLKRRGLFPNTLQVQPVAWELDEETQAEVDRLYARMQASL
ncbi:4-hydroxy-tetrahydrodipicolinate synthase [Roseimaritima multifibrata]|uniref:4-hydroxy-tetrahydrodipicolinate synthase n=1 Tax=Roseimaritima multifibrata TaxID=1930274 RepID=A0A517MAF4_9BACT|nr:dihydrodipicolinate synthase family protein [Roseimaritima multifibrata]QDS91854.1 4-hydroxy-tetrahydrodipicolinate synthase [Roseimaritima multifibrata]